MYTCAMSVDAPTAVAFTPSVSHSMAEESAVAKARWFRSLSLSERMDLLCELTDLALGVHPQLARDRHAQPSAGRVQVLRAP